MKSKLYPICLFLALFLLSNAAFGQTNLLFVGDITNSADTALRAYLVNEGYTVTVIPGSEFTGYTEASAYAEYDVLFLSEVISSVNANCYRTAGYPIPCVSTEGYVVRSDRWGWLENNDTQFFQLTSPGGDEDMKTLIIDNEEHYITKWYGEGTEVDWTSIESIVGEGVTGMTLDQTMSEAFQLAHSKNAQYEGFPSFWAVPAGSSVTHAGNSDIINNNVVILGIHRIGLEGGHATDDFNKLIKRSLEWATDNLSSVEDFNDEKEYDLSIMPNPTSGMVNLSFALDASGNVQIDVYDITGKLIESIEPGHFDAGRNTFTLDFTDKPNAPYIISLITDNNVLTRKILKN